MSTAARKDQQPAARSVTPKINFVPCHWSLEKTSLQSQDEETTSNHQLNKRVNLKPNQSKMITPKTILLLLTTSIIKLAPRQTSNNPNYNHGIFFRYSIVNSSASTVISAGINSFTAPLSWSDIIATSRHASSGRAFSK